jgi:cell division septal protein FtsQ
MNTAKELIRMLQQLTEEQKNLPIVAYDLEHNMQFSIGSIDKTLQDRIDLNLTF